MRVSDSRRVLFIHVPKTGGSTIDGMFDTEVDDTRRVEKCSRHATYARMLKVEPALADYWAFGFVRNPWARMVSWWSMVAAVWEKYDAGDPKAVAKIQNFPKAWLPEGEFRHDFDRFVLEGTEKIAKVGRPQSVTLSRKDGSMPEFVGRLENFDADFNVVRERLGLAPLEAAPQRNVSSHGHYSDYYNHTTRQKVAEVFERDIDLFGYTFESR